MYRIPVIPPDPPKVPLEAIKVDRSFVNGLGIDAEDSTIVEAVVKLGHSLGLQVVEVALPALRRRYPDLALVDDAVTWKTNFVLRGPTSLMLRAEDGARA